MSIRNTSLLTFEEFYKLITEPKAITWANTNNITLPSGNENLQLAYLKHYYPEAFL